MLILPAAPSATDRIAHNICRECVVAVIIRVYHIKSAFNRADILTKPLASMKVDKIFRLSKFGKDNNKVVWYLVPISQIILHDTGNYLYGEVRLFQSNLISVKFHITGLQMPFNSSDFHKIRSYLLSNHGATTGGKFQSISILVRLPQALGLSFPWLMNTGCSWAWSHFPSFIPIHLLQFAHAAILAYCSDIARHRISYSHSRPSSSSSSNKFSEKLTLTFLSSSSIGDLSTRQSSPNRCIS